MKSLRKIPLKNDPSSPKLSQVVYGAWRLADIPEEATVNRVLDKIQFCLDYGITTFDHADIYGDYRCEELFGHALAESPGLREKIQLVTKCGICLVSSKRPSHGIKHYNSSAEHIVWSAENSLKKLQTDRIDLLLLHRPDLLMDADEAAEAFTKLQKQGKVLHFGVSNFTPSQFRLLNSRFPLMTNQVEINPLRLDPFNDGTLDLCQEMGIAPMAWSPLAGGKIFSNEPDGAPARVKQALEEVLEVTEATSIDQLALAWLIRHPSRIIPVIGSRDSERIKRSALACEVKITLQDWYKIYRASLGQDVP